MVSSPPHRMRMDIHEEVFVNTLHYPPPPATVPIEDLGQYLYEQRLCIVHSFFAARGEFIVEVADKPADISTEIPDEVKS